jgi:hypothetical protein
MKESFISYKGFRWFWFNLFFVAILLVFYFFDDPLAGRRGDTPLGYAFGGIATVGIVILMWLGRRKRAYASSRTHLIGWVSAHVWLGLSLLLIVPLHCGFQFGFNVHSITYYLMVATILTGVWGAYNYIQYPSQIISHRGGQSIANILESIRDTTKSLQGLEHGKSDGFIDMVNIIDIPFNPGFLRILCTSPQADLEVEKITHFISGLPDEEHDSAIKAVGLVRNKEKLMLSLKQEVGVNFFMKIWLYFHIPLAIGLVFSLVIHIYSVFYFW